MYCMEISILFKHINIGTRRHQIDMHHLNHLICLRAGILHGETKVFYYYQEHKSVTIASGKLYDVTEQSFSFPTSVSVGI